MARPFYRCRQHPLVLGAQTREPARRNLAPLCNKFLQPAYILIINALQFFNTKLASLPFKEKLAFSRPAFFKLAILIFWSSFGESLHNN
jgi:hypothetical protein